MVETVTDIIISRSRQQDGLKTMMVWSVAGHVGILALALLWPSAPTDEAPRAVMTISLGGSPGPRTGGLTQSGGAPVQAPAPEPPKVETPPAAKAPVMSLPDPRTKTRPQARPKEAPEEANARTPSTGEVPRSGEARVRGQGFGSGLSSSGGSGGPVQLDVTDFCCTEYLEQMVTLIQRSWDQNQSVTGSTTMKFTVLRDGTIQAPLVEKSSGFVVLDNASMRALQLTRLTPLPAAFPNPTLTVHMRFDYQR